MCSENIRLESLVNHSRLSIGAQLYSSSGEGNLPQLDGTGAVISMELHIESLHAAQDECDLLHDSHTALQQRVAVIEAELVFRATCLP